MKLRKKLIAAFLTATLTFTTTINANAYLISGNQAIADGGSNIEGALLNLAALVGIEDDSVAMAELAYDCTKGDYFSLIEAAADDYIADSLGPLGKLYSASKLCVSAYIDLGISIGQLSKANRDWYESCDMLYQGAINDIMELSDLFYEQGLAGKTISSETIKGAQNFIVSLHEIANQIRKDAKSINLRKYRSLLKDCAQKLDDLVDATDINGLYNEGLAKYKASLTPEPAPFKTDNSFSFYACREENSSDAAAVFSMICNYKGICTTQSNIMQVAKNNFWNNCEPYFGLNDGGSYRLLSGNSQDKIISIKGCIRYTPAVIKIRNDIAPYYYTYIVGVFVEDSLFILDPTANANKGLTVNEYASLHGLSEKDVFDKMIAAWSYC